MLNGSELTQEKAYAVSDKCGVEQMGDASNGSITHVDSATRPHEHGLFAGWLYLAQSGVHAATCSWFFSIQAVAASSCASPSTSASAAA